MTGPLGPRPLATTAAVLHLSWLRSSALVGAALAARFPTARSWEEVMSDPTFQAEIAAFAGVVDDIRNHVQIGDAMDLELLESTGAEHYGRALESLALTAERWGVEPEDLLVVLIHA